MAYEILDNKTIDKMWKKFENKFKFKPRYLENAIIEPSPSLVYQLNENYDEWDIDKLDEFFKKIFCRTIAKDEQIIALDWQHNCYKFYPHEDYSDLPINIYPNGDYYIFLTPDMKNVTFGHPWQRTLFVYGETFTPLVRKNKPKLLKHLIRENIIY